MSQVLLNGGSYRGEDVGDRGRIDVIFNHSATSRHWIRAGALPLRPCWSPTPIGQVDRTRSLVLIEYVIAISLVWSAGELVGQRQEALIEAVPAAIEQI